MLLIVVGIVAFFHYTQGFFSAFLSLVMSVIALAVAFGFHEQVVGLIAQGKFADQSHAIILCVLYAVTYIALRAVFDQFVPGNVNYGALPDKIGAGVCGLIVGLITGGVVGVAAQSLPFGPSIGMFSRYETLGDRKNTMQTVPNWAKVGRSDIADHLDSHDEMKDVTIDPSKASGPLVAADGFALGLFNTLSSGSLSGETKWSDVHPDYGTELFAQRLGMQPGAKKTAFPVNKQPAIQVEAMFIAPEKMDQIDGDLPEFRPPGYENPSAKLTAPEGKTLIIVRALVKGENVETTDNYARFGLASFRLCAGGKNFYPTAWVRKGEKAVFQKLDDFLVMGGNQTIDLVYAVDTELLHKEDGASALMALPGKSFLEFKRLSRWLADSPIKPAAEYQPNENSKGPLRRSSWEQKNKLEAAPVQ
jgi:hypothetical protein